VYKAIRTSVVSVESGKVLQVFPNKNVIVETEAFGTIKGIDKSKNCIVLSLESGPNSSITEHALNKNEAIGLLLDLIGSLSAMGDPIALMLKDSLPNSIDDIPMEYRHE
jgi:hypothetical protein